MLAGRIRPKSLTTSGLELYGERFRGMHSFVLLRLDHCNGVLVGLPRYRLHQLKLVLNAAAQLLADLPKYTRISAFIRKKLHWLPVPDRISYKITTLVWKAMAGVALDYIAELCQPVLIQPGRRMLQSAAKGDVMVPRSRTPKCSQRGLL